jgi:hypothetical protein
MASEAKKKKARNSYMHNGGMKSKRFDGDKFQGIKRLDYYTASDRQQLKKGVSDDLL